MGSEFLHSRAGARAFLASSSRFAAIAVAALTTCAFALQPPTPEEIVRLREAGTLDERVQEALALGNHLISPRLLAKSRAYRPTPAQGVGPGQATDGLPATGAPRVFALLIAFSDLPYSNQAVDMDSKLFGDGSPADFPYESLRSYYLRSSHGLLQINGDTLGWYTTSYPRSQVAQTTAGREALVREALDYFDAQGHDFSQYDNNGDGTIDYFLVFWTGPSGSWNSFWWAKKLSWTDSSYTLDAKRLSDYSWQSEGSTSPGGFKPRTAIHETGHALGLPDLYDYPTTTQGPNGGVGGLDMMDSNWGDHNAFSKFLLGWLTPQAYSSGEKQRPFCKFRS